MSDLSLSGMKIIALFLQSIFFGAYLVSLAKCLHSILISEPTQHLRWYILIVALCLAGVGTLDLALGLRHVLDGFVFYKGPGGPEHVFMNTSNWLQVLKTACLMIQTLIGDGFLIYRCFVVYNRRWMVVLPSIIFWLAGITTFVYFITRYATLTGSALLDANTKWLSTIMIAFLSITLALTVTTTSLIVYRIWRVIPDPALVRINRGGNSALKDAIRIIIESGLLYALFVLIMFGSCVAKSVASYPASDVLIVVTGISFNLVIIRASSLRKKRASQRASYIATGFELVVPGQPQGPMLPTSNAASVSPRRATLVEFTGSLPLTGKEDKEVLGVVNSISVTEGVGRSTSDVNTPQSERGEV